MRNAQSPEGHRIIRTAQFCTVPDSYLPSFFVRVHLTSHHRIAGRRVSTHTLSLCLNFAISHPPPLSDPHSKLIYSSHLLLPPSPDPIRSPGAPEGGRYIQCHSIACTSCQSPLQQREMRREKTSRPPPAAGIPPRGRGRAAGNNDDRGREGEGDEKDIRPYAGKTEMKEEKKGRKLSAAPRRARTHACMHARAKQSPRLVLPRCLVGRLG